MPPFFGIWSHTANNSKIMSRPVRIEFPGACYHVTSRGVEDHPVFADRDDRGVFLNVLENVVDRCDVGIDFHAGSDDRTNLPQIRGNMKDAETLRLARAFGPDVIVDSKTIKGTIRETALW